MTWLCLTDSDPIGYSSDLVGGLSGLPGLSGLSLTGLFAISGYSGEASGRCFGLFWFVFLIVFHQLSGQNFHQKSLKNCFFISCFLLKSFKGL